MDLADLITPAERLARICRCGYCRREIDRYEASWDVRLYCSSGCIDRARERENDPPVVEQIFASIFGLGAAAALVLIVLTIANVVRSWPR